MAPLLFFTPNQRPCVKAIYGPAVHSRHLPHIYMPRFTCPHPQPFAKCMASQPPVSWVSHSKNVWQGASACLGACTMPLGRPYAMRMPRGRATARRGLGNPQVTLKQPSDKSQATLEQTPRRPERFHERFVKGFMKYL